MVVKLVVVKVGQVVARKVELLEKLRPVKLVLRKVSLMAAYLAVYLGFESVDRKVACLVEMMVVLQMVASLAERKAVWRGNFSVARKVGLKVEKKAENSAIVKVGLLVVSKDYNSAALMGLKSVAV